MFIICWLASAGYYKKKVFMTCSFPCCCYTRNVFLFFFVFVSKTVFLEALINAFTASTNKMNSFRGSMRISVQTLKKNIKFYKIIKSFLVYQTKHLFDSAVSVYDECERWTFKFMFIGKIMSF